MLPERSKIPAVKQMIASEKAELGIEDNHGFADVFKYAIQQNAAEGYGRRLGGARLSR